MIPANTSAWAQELGPLLTTSQLMNLLEIRSRQSVSERLASRRLIGLRDGTGRLRFPAFQAPDGVLTERLVPAFWAVADGAGDPWLAAAWCTSPDTALEGESPVTWLAGGGDPDHLLLVDRQDAARLAQ